MKKYFKKQYPKLQISSKTLSHHVKKLSELQVEFYRDQYLDTNAQTAERQSREKNININKRQSCPWENAEGGSSTN